MSLWGSSVDLCGIMTDAIKCLSGYSSCAEMLIESWLLGYCSGKDQRPIWLCRVLVFRVSWVWDSESWLWMKFNMQIRKTNWKGDRNIERERSWEAKRVDCSTGEYRCRGRSRNVQEAPLLWGWSVCRAAAEYTIMFLLHVLLPFTCLCESS